ncbi:hypothetical protein B0H13DRAFT_2280713 [Mycena leptocephala]|nr:hypothetical protein B0H13DRAFT_2280713 [Mycena leptocephala]
MLVLRKERDTDACAAQRAEWETVSRQGASTEPRPTFAGGNSIAFASARGLPQLRTPRSRRRSEREEHRLLLDVHRRFSAPTAAPTSQHCPRCSPSASSTPQASHRAHRARSPRRLKAPSMSWCARPLQDRPHAHGADAHALADAGESIAEDCLLCIPGPTSSARRRKHHGGGHWGSLLGLADVSGGRSRSSTSAFRPTPKLHRRTSSPDGKRSTTTNSSKSIIELQPIKDEGARRILRRSGIHPGPTKHEGGRGGEGRRSFPCFCTWRKTVTLAGKRRRRAVWGREIGQGSIRISDSGGSMRREEGLGRDCDRRGRGQPTLRDGRWLWECRWLVEAAFYCKERRRGEEREEGSEKRKSYAPVECLPHPALAVPRHPQDDRSEEAKAAGGCAGLDAHM